MKAGLNIACRLKSRELTGHPFLPEFVKTLSWIFAQVDPGTVLTGQWIGDMPHFYNIPEQKPDILSKFMIDVN